MQEEKGPHEEKRRHDSMDSSKVTPPPEAEKKKREGEECVQWGKTESQFCPYKAGGGKF